MLLTRVGAVDREAFSGCALTAQSNPVLLSARVGSCPILRSGRPLSITAVATRGEHCPPTPLCPPGAHGSTTCRKIGMARLDGAPPAGRDQRRNLPASCALPVRTWSKIWWHGL